MEFKNNCTTSTRRKYICESVPVLIGKALYSSSVEQQNEFWKRIFVRRNQIINDIDVYKERLVKDIMAIPDTDVVDVEKILVDQSELKNTL